MTESQRRQLRQNIRNFYLTATREELVEARWHRIVLGRSEFEIACFDELIKESA
jgi:hypothetical protein